MNAYAATLQAPPLRRTEKPVGDLLREWRQRRRLSQLELAGEADVSTRHLSFVETGRSLPSREMLMRLSERLEIPLRERNTLLTAAGYAPMYRERPLDDPALAAAREAVELVLKGHEPYPALAVDRHWQLVVAQPRGRAVPRRCERGAAEAAGQRDAPEPASRGSGAAHREPRAVARASADATAAAGRRERRRGARRVDRGARRVPGAGRCRTIRRDESIGGVIVPLQVRMPDGGVLSFISTTTVFGTPVDITLSELALETFFPADEATAQALRRLGDGRGGDAATINA